MRIEQATTKGIATTIAVEQSISISLDVAADVQRRQALARAAAETQRWQSYARRHAMVLLPVYSPQQHRGYAYVRFESKLGNSIG